MAGRDTAKGHVEFYALIVRAREALEELADALATSRLRQ